MTRPTLSKAGRSLWLVAVIWLYACQASPPKSRPPTPLNVTARAVSRSEVFLEWTDVPDETSYEVQRRTGMTDAYSLVGRTGPNATSHRSTGLAAEKTYFFMVRACNEAGCSPYSREASATTPAVGAR